VRAPDEYRFKSKWTEKLSDYDMTGVDLLVMFSRRQHCSLRSAVVENWTKKARFTSVQVKEPKFERAAARDHHLTKVWVCEAHM